MTSRRQVAERDLAGILDLDPGLCPLQPIGIAVSLRFVIKKREAELQEQAGRSSKMRPRYIDEPKKSVVVNLDTSGLKKKSDDKPE